MTINYNPDRQKIGRELQNMKDVIGHIRNAVNQKELLQPQDLIGHIIKFSLSFLTIYDMTKTMKLKGNYIYVICIKSAV
jgi:hypothetical protein